MRKKTLLLGGFITACLLGWTGLLPVKGGFVPPPSKPAAQEPDNGDQDDSADGGQEGSGGQDDNGDENAPGNKGKITPPVDEDGTGGSGEEGDGGDEGEGGGEGSGGGGGRGGGFGGGHGGGHGGKTRAPAKKVSLKDSLARAAKYTAKKQYASATKEYNNALTVLADDDGRKVYVYERQGWLALMSNDISSAEGFYLAAIYQAEKIETYDKSAVNAYRGAAYCYEKDGDISSAVENYQLALKHATDKGTKADIRKKLQRLQAGKRKKAR